METEGGEEGRRDDREREGGTEGRLGGKETPLGEGGKSIERKMKKAKEEKC